VRRSVHWTWSFTHPDTGQTLGKRNVLNNFCANVRTNEPRCTSCHTGYGWTDAAFDFNDDTRVDCLVCHDTTGTYTKAPKAGGRVLKESTTVHGKTLTPPDLGKVARNVGPPSVASCGSCHFYGGGGDGSKHGDLDSSLVDAPRELSVHMSPEGGDMACSDCHVTRGHDMAGGQYDFTARDTAGTGKPGMRRHAATCESCHGTDPHSAGTYIARTLNTHGDRVACQTCHIPEIARGGVATKVWWDWSKAGRTGDDGASIHETNADGRTTYWSRWGEIRWDSDFPPAYAWANGTLRYTMPSDTIDPDSPPVPINTPLGGPDDPDSRIWPFKLMRGKQPYDPETKRLLPRKLVGGPDAFWKTLDWQPAIAAATEAMDLPFSGEVAFVRATTHRPITHMVAPAEDALRCGACHTTNGRLAAIDGVYMPGRDGNVWLDRAGVAAILLTLAGVAGHAGLRVVFRHRRRHGA
jgi:octaheme c-type cytochrome (tetrathionate reductase family)